MRKPLSLLATTVATLAFASPALAQTTNVGPLAGPNGNVSFGVGWAAGAPAGPGLLNWNPVGAMFQPNLTGQLNMRDQPAGATAYLQLEYRDANHVIIGTQDSTAQPGVPGARISYPVNLGTLVTPSDHVHVHLIRNGSVLDTAICDITFAGC
jgi:hypothetical protein